MSFLEIEQGFIEKFRNADLEIGIVYENQDKNKFDLDDNLLDDDPFAELFFINNDITMYSLADSKQTEGIFRIFLYYPLNELSIRAKKKADEIFKLFDLNTIVSYGDTKSKIVKQDIKKDMRDEAYYTLILSIYFKTFI